MRRWLVVAVVAWAVALVVVTAASTGFAWRPVAQDLSGIRVTQAVAAAERIERGASLEEAEAALGIDLRYEEGDAEGPPHPPGAPPAPFASWTAVPGHGRPVWVMRGGEVATRAGADWIVLHDHTAWATVVRLLSAGSAAAIPMIGLAWWGAARAMRPLTAAREAMNRISTGELDHRLDEDEGPAELRELARHFNRMAAAVQTRLATERQIMAGISHELRTPLTRIRLEVELGRTIGASDDRLDRIDREIEQANDLLAELLELSAMEVGQVQLRREPLDLAALACEVAGERDGVTIVGAGRCEADPRLVRRALENLLRNCDRHAHGAAVRIEVSDAGFVVDDAGGGRVPDPPADLFEPFWRAPGARGAGHGVGLAIVRHVAQLHGGTARAENGETGLRIVLRLRRGGSDACSAAP